MSANASTFGIAVVAFVVEITVVGDRSDEELVDRAVSADLRRARAAEPNRAIALRSDSTEPRPAIVGRAFHESFPEPFEEWTKWPWHSATTVRRRVGVDHVAAASSVS